MTTAAIDALNTALQGRYSVEREIGVGGMATVYLAHDVKHERKVALKVLKPELAAVVGADRFLAEIKTTANLQHPHILPLFDSGKLGTVLFYAMPYVDGETLADRLDREKELPIEEAVRIATDVAEALHAAHDQGVIHRDIKPANILMSGGRAVVADFGIALAVSAAGGSRMTETGLSLGTLLYMSPEQATGDHALTAQSDVYSLACVLYEMLAGSPPHLGASSQNLFMKIVTEIPAPITEVRRVVPPNVSDAIETALEKLPADRFTTARDFAEALRNPAYRARAGQAQAAGPQLRRWKATAGGLAVLLAVTLGLALTMRPVEVPRQVFRVSVDLEGSGGVGSPIKPQFALSPDGSHLAYPGNPDSGEGRQQLWLRDLGAPLAHALDGTQGVVAPFFSPDGQEIAFMTSTELRIVTVDGGGSRIVLTDSVAPWGGDWSRDGWLYVTKQDGRLVRVRPDGTGLEPVSAPDTARGETFHEYAHTDPSARHVLHQMWIRSITETEVGVTSLETGETRPLVKAVGARFLSDRQVAYVTANGELLVAEFDPRSLALTSPGSVIERGIHVDAWSGVALFDVSDAGHLVYARATEVEADQVVWVDRAGVVEPLDPPWEGVFGDPEISPDGTELAVVVFTPEGDEVWAKEFDGERRQLTFAEGPYGSPAWTADGSGVTFVSGSSAPLHVLQRRADGGGATERLGIEPASAFYSMSWSPDGAWLTFVAERAGAGPSIRVVRAGDWTSEHGLLPDGTVATSPAISPDGRWLAYVSPEFGRDEVVLTRFPEPGPGDKWRVSLEGGTEPRWSHDGSEIFYRTPSGGLVTRRVQLGASVRIEAERLLFDASPFYADARTSQYAVGPDDSRFVMVRFGGATPSLVMVVNWLDGVRAQLAN